MTGTLPVVAVGIVTQSANLEGHMPRDSSSGQTGRAGLPPVPRPGRCDSRKHERSGLGRCSGRDGEGKKKQSRSGDRFVV